MPSRKWGLLKIEWSIDGLRRGDKCSCGAEAPPPSMRVLACVLKSILDISKVLKSFTLRYFASCAKCKRLLPLACKIYVEGRS